MRKVYLASVLWAAAVAPSIVGAQEVEVTGNAGWTSEYYYRGIQQTRSSASAGLDLGVGGLYAGTWAADVGDGAEVDLYAGFGFDVGPLSLGIGGTGYFYTGEFDDTYLEANLLAGIGPVGVEFSIGQWDGDPKSDYTFLGVTAGHLGFFGTLGSHGGDFSGSYAEVGYEFEVAGLDMGISWIHNDEDLSGLGRSDNALVLGITRTFTIR
jgi:uncharacterized protein (TIGR02001 family)